VIVSGIGKSGIIARKIAATLTSTGTPAAFLHPVEGLHGDLGIVGDDDVAILISKSGDSSELDGLVEHLSRRGVAIVAMTGRPDSLIGRAASVVLDCSVAEEACPHDLAPTTSTTATLAMGDALAVALLSMRGFSRDDFARLHPGGTLGRKLTLRVRDVMLREDLPKLGAEAPMRQCIVLLAGKRGTVAIVDSEDRVVGVVTAGDLTRLMERTDAIFDVPVADVMTRTPRVTTEETLAAAAVYQMETHGIMALPVVDGDQELVGIVHLHDLMRAGAA
jgi:arabinose-5-phosphate isomerase